MLSFIYSILEPCFKSLNHTKLNSLSKAITCVALGLRTCHLLDITHLDLNQAKSLLIKLRKHPACKSIVLLQFKDRFTFLCNKSKLLQYETNDLIYIAVEGKEPIKLNEPPIQLIYWIENKILPFLSSSSKYNVYYYSDIIPTCMVSLTGWLLEYPIIYTTHLITDKPQDELDEWEQRTNCLCSVSLLQVWLSDHMLYSFSYPTTVDINGSQLANELKRKINQRLDDLTTRSDWLKNVYCEIRREQIKLDRFAL